MRLCALSGLPQPWTSYVLHYMTPRLDLLGGRVGSKLEVAREGGGDLPNAPHVPRPIVQQGDDGPSWCAGRGGGGGGGGGGEGGGPGRRRHGSL